MVKGLMGFVKLKICNQFHASSDTDPARNHQTKGIFIKLKIIMFL